VHHGHEEIYHDNNGAAAGRHCYGDISEDNNGDINMTTTKVKKEKKKKKRKRKLVR